MAQTTITYDAYQCDRCSHEWVPKSYDERQKPRVCPKCKSPYWDTPRKKPPLIELLTRGISPERMQDGTTEGYMQLFDALVGDKPFPEPPASEEKQG